MMVVTPATGHPSYVFPCSSVALPPSSPRTTLPAEGVGHVEHLLTSRDVQNIGVSQSNGKWLSVFQNKPTNKHGKLDFNVKIVGDDLSCDCRYENGKYLQDGEPVVVDGEIIEGCTVSGGHRHVARRAAAVS